VVDRVGARAHVGGVVNLGSSVEKFVIGTKRQQPGSASRSDDFDAIRIREKATIAERITDSTIPGQEWTHNHLSLISGAIVGNDQLDIEEGLGKGGSHGTGDVLPFVVGRHHHGKDRLMDGGRSAMKTTAQSYSYR
jgi:hypothetical protein